MNRAEQIEFVNDYLDVIREGIVKKIYEQKVPDNWDGFELRHLIDVITTQENFLSPTRTKFDRSKQARRRKCEEEIYSNNLS